MNDYLKMMIFASILLFVGILMIIIGSEIPVIPTKNGFVITKESIMVTGIGFIIVIGAFVSFSKSKKPFPNEVKQE